MTERFDLTMDALKKVKETKNQTTANIQRNNFIKCQINLSDFFQTDVPIRL